MSARLLPCPGCARHVRVSDSLCPFCGEALPLAYQNAGPAPLPKVRLGRAAKFAFGAAVASTMSLTGCGDDGTPSDTGAGDTGITVDSATGDTGATDAAMDTGAVVPPYGIPPDTGPDSDVPDGGGDAASDASSTGDSGVAPAYGTPPSE